MVLVLVGCGSEPPPRVEALIAAPPGPGGAALHTSETTLGGVPPLSELNIGFDRPLSIARLGATVIQGVPFLDRVVDIVWENAPPGSRKIDVQEVYRPQAPMDSGNPGRPTITLSTVSHIPAGARLRLHLDRARLAGEDGAALEGPGDLFVETTPLAVRLSGETTTVDNITPITLVFNNRGAFDLPEHVKVTLDGQPLEVLVTKGNPNQNEFLVLGPWGAWPRPGRYEVVIDGGAADDFGQTLAAPVTLSFEVR